jgi:hypothetical protein
VPGGGGYASITVGGQHACALTSTGRAECWGGGGSGQLGDGQAGARPDPAAVIGGHVFTDITAGFQYTCGLTETGEAWCWGDNRLGQLGNASVAQFTAVPVPVSTQLRFDDIEGGLGMTCGVSGGEVWCWGTEFGGGFVQVGIPTRVPVQAPLAAVAPGTSASCVLAETGAAYCWGANGYTWGQLGTGSLMSSTSPVEVAGGISFAKIDAARANHIFAGHVCGLAFDGEAWCWGMNRFFELGSADAADICPNSINPQLGGPLLPCALAPVRVTTGQRFAAIASGYAFSCGITHQSSVYCWGRGGGGNLGRGDLANHPRPVPVGAPTDPPVVTSFDLLLDGATVAVGDTLYGRMRTLDQNGFELPVFATLTVSDTTIASLEYLPDQPVCPAGGFRLIARTRGTVTVSGPVGSLIAQETVVVN